MTIKTPAQSFIYKLGLGLGSWKSVMKDIGQVALAHERTEGSKRQTLLQIIAS